MGVEEDALTVNSHIFNVLTVKNVLITANKRKYLLVFAPTKHSNYG
ncbi:hypothetical protein NUACC21_56220 [Scytonema sp. NUACC21]